MKQYDCFIEIWSNGEETNQNHLPIYYRFFDDIIKKTYAKYNLKTVAVFKIKLK